VRHSRAHCSTPLLSRFPFPLQPGRFDVQVPSRIYALKCEQASELSRWVKVLESLIAANVYQKPSALPDSAIAAMRKTTTSSKATGDFSADAAEAIDLMSRGAAFIKYNYESVTEKTSRDIVMVWYKKDDTPLGSLYFCEPGDKNEDKKTALSLATLTDIYV